MNHQHLLCISSSSNNGIIQYVLFVLGLWRLRCALGSLSGFVFMYSGKSQELKSHTPAFQRWQALLFTVRSQECKTAYPYGNLKVLVCQHCVVLIVIKHAFRQKDFILKAIVHHNVHRNELLLYWVVPLVSTHANAKKKKFPYEESNWLFSPQSS